MKIVKFGFALFGINTYVVVDTSTGKCAIIDPGMIDQEEENAIADFINRNGYEVTHLINTHLHIDHVAGNSFTTDRFHVPVLAHPDDKILGACIDQQAAQFGICGKINNVSMYDRDGGYVITGDALFAGSIGRTDLPGGDYPQLINSIRNKLLELPDSTVVYPGHGPATTIGAERQNNPFLRQV